MSSIKLKHASGNGVSITAPSSNPAADRTLELPSDADGIIAKTDASGNLAVTGDLTVDTSTLKVDSSNNRVYVGNTGLGATAEADDLVVGNLTGGHGITIHSQNNEGGFICFGDADTTGVDSRRGVIRYQHSDDSLILATAETTALTISSSQNATFAGTVSDSKGNLRSIPKTIVNSNHVATAADAGKCIYIAYDVHFNPSVFSAGDAVTIVNNSGNDETIKQNTGFTLYNTADGSTGDRTLAGRGMATVWFADHNIGYISGAGLS